MSEVLYEAVEKVPIGEFLPELEFEFTDAPAAMLEHYVVRTVMRMCDRSNVLRRAIRITPQRHAHNYRLEPIDDVDFHAVMAVGIERSCFCAPRLIRVTGPAMRCQCTPYSYAYVDHNEIVFTDPRPGDVYRVDISVRPRHNACEIDRVVYDNYMPVLVEGVRAALCSMADKPWSSWERSQLAERNFIQGCCGIALDTMMGRQRGALRIKPPRAL